ncbi:MAG: hypothetical protein GQ564_04940 [Bacteroidales bacterium]|nr:hypothetical protein [Bacteroidales bacterium]
MKSNRDDFTKPTKCNLAKRVGYLCSNPECRRHTVGPNENPDKSTNIGIAAHITAASANGPRYDNNLDDEERTSSENGIWLCSNCATLIDRDIDNYSVILLKQWKEDAEKELYEKLVSGVTSSRVDNSGPFLEADLIWTHNIRFNKGFSPKNRKEKNEEIILIGANPIVFWELKWYFTFKIYNNSSFPAFNVSIKSKGDKNFKSISELPRINNIPALSPIDLKATYGYMIEDTGREASKRLRQLIPEELIGLEMEINYQDESRNDYLTTFKILENGEIENLRK